MDNQKSDDNASTLIELSKKIEYLETELNNLKKLQPENKVTLIISTGDFDKILSAFIISSSAAAMGCKVSIFFTFWGLSAIRKKSVLNNKKLTEKMMALMMPSSNKKLPLSKMNMLGIGPIFFKYVMKEHNVSSLQDLINLNIELGVEMTSCQMTMGIMGISKDELLDNIQYAGAAKCIEDALHSRFTLFF